MSGRSFPIAAALALLLGGCASMPMTAAVDAGNSAEVSRQLAQGVDPNLPDERGVTPLALAAYRGRADIAEELLARGARPGQPIKNGATPMLIAVWNGHLDVAKLLLKHGADLTAGGNGGSSALMRAISTGRVDTVRGVIKLGADVNETTPSGETPVHLATYTNHPDIVAALVAAGAKPIGVQGRVGLSVGKSPTGELVVAQVMPDSPASRAGIAAGDKLLEINGDSVEGLTAAQAVSRLRGDPGTAVSLTFAREGRGRLSFQLVRDSVGIGAAPAGTLPPPATKGEWWQQ